MSDNNLHRTVTDPRAPSTWEMVLDKLVDPAIDVTGVVSIVCLTKSEAAAVIDLVKQVIATEKATAAPATPPAPQQQ